MLNGIDNNKGLITLGTHQNVSMFGNYVTRNAKEQNHWLCRVKKHLDLWRWYFTHLLPISAAPTKGNRVDYIG